MLLLFWLTSTRIVMALGCTDKREGEREGEREREKERETLVYGILWHFTLNLAFK